MNRRLYSIKEVSLLTGLSSGLIRKWEERYGAVRPARLSNGYRGYTKEDIDKLAALKREVERGLPIGTAVRGFGAEARIRQDDRPGEGQPAGAKDAVERMLGCFLQLDSAGAQRLYDRLLASYDADYVLLGILQPALVELGERWLRGEISEYQEHFGTHFVREKLLALSSGIPAREDRPLVVTACGPGERHELGILFFGYFALLSGYRIVHLGASPAEKGILDCLDRLRPRAFLFSFTREELLEKAMPFLRELEERIRIRGGSTQVVVGGQIVRKDGILEGTTAVHLLTGNAKEAVEKLKRRVPPS